MSDALTYLAKARADAMETCFAFLKDAGSRLDSTPTTCNLIPLITKVHSRTRNGFRQYVARVLREGAFPDEVLDVVLMAFAALALACPKPEWAFNLPAGQCINKGTSPSITSSTG